MIIVGLGNPGPEYERTRHNVGFMVLDELAKKLLLEPWATDKAVQYTKYREHWLIKPQHYMNVSGEATLGFLRSKHIDSAGLQLLVIHDDLDFPLGEMHEQIDRSSAGHNGVQSFIDMVGKNFPRLRIGIGRPANHHIPSDEYVLQKFDDDEWPIIQNAVQQAAELVAKKLN